MSNNPSSHLINLLINATRVVMLIGHVIMVCLVLALLLSLFGTEGFNWPVEWPVYFSDLAESALLVDHNNSYFARPHDSDFGELKLITAVLSPRDLFWPHYNTYKIFAMALKLALVMGIVYYIRHILLDIKQQKPFNQNNTQRLKYMALMLILMVPLALLDTWIHHTYLINHIELTNIELVSWLFTSDNRGQNMLQENQVLLSNQHNLRPLLYASIVYVIALVFEEGLNLKQDNESIV